jgi:hypothetical protein
MSETLFLINPRRRKKRRKGRMPAGLARYWASRRKNPRKRRRKVSMRRRRRAARAVNPRRRRRAVMANPRRRKRRRNPVYAVTRRRRRHRHVARYRRRKRNPFGSGEIRNVVIPAAIGAGGAIALAVAYGYLSPNLPSSISGVTGASTVLQIAGALGLGFLAARFLGRQRGTYVAMGGLTVVLVNAITPMLSSATGGSIPGMSGFGGLKLGGVGDYITYRRPGAMNPGMGAYLRTPARLQGLGFINPASRLGAYARRPKQIGAYLPNSVPGMRGFAGGYTGITESDGM